MSRPRTASEPVGLFVPRELAAEGGGGTARASALAAVRGTPWQNVAFFSPVGASSYCLAEEDEEEARGGGEGRKQVPEFL